MAKNNIEEIVLEYISGNFDTNRQKELEEILIQNGYTMDEVKELSKMYNQMDNIPVPEPGERMTENFYEMLEAQKEKIQKRSNWLGNLTLLFKDFFKQKYVIRISYSFGLLFVGWGIGFWFSPDSKNESQFNYMVSEIREMKNMITYSMLNQPSATERMKLINSINQEDKTDEKIISALLKTLNHDSNVNVRIVTVEALAKLGESSRVREGLIHSLAIQESPLIQMAIVDFLVALRDKNAIGHLKSLLEKKDLNDTVRSRVEKGLKILI
jgi:HEAT repeats